MKVIRAILLVFGALEQGQDVGIGPAGIAQLCPMIIVLCLAADIDQSIDRTRSSQHLAAWLKYLAAVEFRFRL